METDAELGGDQIIVDLGFVNGVVSQLDADRVAVRSAGVAAEQVDRLADAERAAQVAAIGIEIAKQFIVVINARLVVAAFDIGVAQAVVRSGGGKRCGRQHGSQNKTLLHEIP